MAECEPGAAISVLLIRMLKLPTFPDLICYSYWDQIDIIEVTYNYVMNLLIAKLRNKCRTRRLMGFFTFLYPSISSGDYIQGFKREHKKTWKNYFHTYQRRVKRRKERDFAECEDTDICYDLSWNTHSSKRCQLNTRGDLFICSQASFTSWGPTDSIKDVTRLQGHAFWKSRRVPHISVIGKTVSLGFLWCRIGAGSLLIMENDCYFIFHCRRRGHNFVIWTAVNKCVNV